MGWSEPEPPRGQSPRLFPVRALRNGLCLRHWGAGFCCLKALRPPAGNVKGRVAPVPPPLGHPRLPGGAGEDPGTPVPVARAGRKPPAPEADVPQFAPGDPAGPARLCGPAPAQADSGPSDIAAPLGPTPHQSRRWTRGDVDASARPAFAGWLGRWQMLLSVCDAGWTGGLPSTDTVSVARVDPG